MKYTAIHRFPTILANCSQDKNQYVYQKILISINILLGDIHQETKLLIEKEYGLKPRKDDYYIREIV